MINLDPILSEAIDLQIENCLTRKHKPAFSNLEVKKRHDQAESIREYRRIESELYDYD